MRLLFSSTANDGHFGPLLPLVRACAAARHEVRAAALESYAPALARTGLTHEPFAHAPAGVIGPIMSRLPTMDVEDADALVVREVFGRVDAQAALPALRSSNAGGPTSSYERPPRSPPWPRAGENVCRASDARLVFDHES